MSERPPQTESELVDFVRSIDVRAPQELHERIDALVAESSSAGREDRRAARSFARRAWFNRRLGAAATVAAIVIVALVVALAGTGGSKAMSSGRAYALTQGTPGMPAPSAHGAELAAAVEDVAFPNWDARFGWRSTGERSERVGARAATTVFYETYDGRRIGYAIVAGTPAPRMSGGVVTRLGGTSYRVMSVAGGRLVAWVRDGRLCVIGGPSVSAHALLALASST
jgi:hypothetical protein